MKKLLSVIAVKKIAILLLVLMLVSERQSTQAQALPVVTRVAVAMGGVVERFMLRTGIAANDSRFAATLGALGTAANDAVFGAASTVGMVAAGIAGAPVWATVAIGLGVGALAFGAYKLLTSNAPGGTGIGVFIPSGPPVASGPGNVLSSYADDVNGIPASYAPYVTSPDLTVSGWYLSGTTTHCLPGQLMCGQVVMEPAPAKTVIAPFDQVLKQIPAVELAKPLSNQSMADLVNGALQSAAARPGYSGIPVSLTNPVTAQDVADWLAANPGSMPTGADLLSPLPNGTVSMPPASTTPETPTSPSGGIDLGPDPGIGAPTLEPTPTAQSILQPILNLMPDLKRYVLPSHSGVCPKPEISLPLFSGVFKIEAHCDIAEAMRSSIGSMMVAFWTISSVFIVLAA